MNEDIAKLFERFAVLKDTIESIRAELPQLATAEKELDEVKEQIQKFAKETDGEYSGSGYEVTLSIRETWDTAKLPGYAVAHPDILALRSTKGVATVRKIKGTK